jgi:thymidylate synthase (FAD)
MQEEQNVTKRSTVKSLEDILGKEISLLNKGFIRVVDYMGDDNAIVQAARVSYGKGTQTLNNDEKLIRYLLRHKHTTPFEMCEIKFHIKAPIFIARQWLRHRTANVNEYSARYSVVEDDYYVPTLDNLNVQSKDNKQGRGEQLSEDYGNKVLKDMNTMSENAFKLYNDLLKGDTKNAQSEENESANESIARELARIILPVNVYTQFYWKIDLHNLLHFLELRAHPHAQYEIRVYAEAMLSVLKNWLPITYNAFVDYKTNANTFSSEETEVIARLLKGEQVKHADTKMSKREWDAFTAIFNIK